MVGSMRLIIFRMTHLAEGKHTLTYTPLDLTTSQIGIALVFAVFGFIVVTVIDHMQSQNNPVMRLIGLGSNKAAATAEG